MELFHPYFHGLKEMVSPGLISPKKRRMMFKSQKNNHPEIKDEILKQHPKTIPYKTTIGQTRSPLLSIGLKKNGFPWGHPKIPTFSNSQTKPQNPNRLERWIKIQGTLEAVEPNQKLAIRKGDWFNKSTNGCFRK